MKWPVAAKLSMSTTAMRRSPGSALWECGSIYYWRFAASAFSRLIAGGAGATGTLPHYCYGCAIAVT